MGILNQVCSALSFIACCSKSHDQTYEELVKNLEQAKTSCITKEYLDELKAQCQKLQNNENRSFRFTGLASVFLFVSGIAAIVRGSNQNVKIIGGVVCNSLMLVCCYIFCTKVKNPSRSDQLMNQLNNLKHDIHTKIEEGNKQEMYTN